MKNLLAGFLCVGLCISIAILLPQVGQSFPDNEFAECLVCHEAPVGEGLHETHSGFDCSVCHGENVGGPVQLEDCLVCHIEEGGDLCDVVDAHPESAGCLECHEDCAVAEGCAVTIDCGTTELCPDDECTTCTATTECDGVEVDGEYTWDLNMAGTTGNTGNSIEICPEDLNDGDNTLMVTDTANDAEDTETIGFNGSACQEPTECIINVIVESLPKSNWFALPLFFRIETVGIDPTLLTPVNIACEADEMGALGLASVLKTGKVIIPSFGTTPSNIFQTVIVWPTWVTQSGGMGSETCTVTVGDCGATDTFELNYLPFFLSE